MNAGVFGAAALLSVIVLLAAAPASAQTTGAQFRIRESNPVTGSNIRRDLVKSATLPLNRRYAELTAEERAALHSQWESIGEGDEPPFPAEGLLPIVDAIRQAQAKLLVEGMMRLHVEVDSAGRPAAVKVVQAVAPEMTRFAASALMLTSFKPAICAGVPCRMEYPLIISFTVR